MLAIAFCCASKSEPEAWVDANNSARVPSLEAQTPYSVEGREPISINPSNRTISPVGSWGSRDLSSRPVEDASALIDSATALCNPVTLKCSAVMAGLSK